MKSSLLTLLLLLAMGLSAQDCAPGWSFYRNLTVDNTAGEALTDHQIKVRLNTSELVAAGKLREDGADLRFFTTDCTPLPFWGDSLGNSINTDIWVKLPNLDAGASVTVQVYYGKSDATNAADGDDTFLFFDDFNATAVDITKWETVGEFAQFEIQDSTLLYGSTSMVPGGRFKFARTVPSFAGPVIFDFNGSVNNSNGFGFSSGDVDLDRILFRISGTFGFDTINQVAVMMDTLDNGFALENLYPLLRFPRNQFQTHSVTLGINAGQQLEVTNYTNVGSGAANTNTYTLESGINMSSFHFIMSSFNASSATRLNNVRVRAFTPNQPIATTGEELMATPSAVNFLLNANQVQVFPNPATNQFQVIVSANEQLILSLYDATGREVTQTIHANGPTDWTVDVSKFPRGVHFLQLRRLGSGELLYAQKVLIE